MAKIVKTMKKTGLKKVVNKKENSIMTQQRIVDTANLLLNFNSRRVIIDHLTSTYGIAERSCDAIISNAYAFIRENYKTDRDSIVITHIEFYYEIARENKIIDPKASLKALEQIEKLLKLHKDDPIFQNNTLNLNFEKVTTEEIKVLIDRMKDNKTNA